MHQNTHLSIITKKDFAEDFAIQTARTFLSFFFPAANLSPFLPAGVPGERGTFCEDLIPVLFVSQTLLPVLGGGFCVSLSNPFFCCCHSSYVVIFSSYSQEDRRYTPKWHFQFPPAVLEVRRGSTLNSPDKGQGQPHPTTQRVKIPIVAKSESPTNNSCLLMTVCTPASPDEPSHCGGVMLLSKVFDENFCTDEKATCFLVCFNDNIGFYNEAQQVGISCTDFKRKCSCVQ
ncbi:uncharacterized protein [Emydura macquarii macquarii]|uniref:uncharacterized protein n=1 Tax=Emydura macquarii macquarii TaxID=1129001 RepID=UPI003529FF20